jgi:hypothetical protein
MVQAKIRVGQDRIYDRISGKFPARNTVYAPYIYTILGLNAPCVLIPVYLSTQSDPLKTGHMHG